MKYFIITVDAEEDNQWDPNQKGTTENAKFIPRFQELCEKFQFVPVYLTTYGMAKDPFYMEYMRLHLAAGTCEIGMHLHAWDTPPYYDLHAVNSQRPYLIEYPLEVMEEKIQRITLFLEDCFQSPIISHRAGRWAMDQTYFELLEKYNYKVDCSITPFVNWGSCLGATGIPGINYSNISINPYYVNNIYEVPVTIRRMRSFDFNRICSLNRFLHEFYHYIKLNNIWMRPGRSNSVYDIKNLIQKVKNEQTDYIMFMIHSSELKPGCSPNFPDEASIERLYENLTEIFSAVHENNYTGISLKNYYNIHK